MNKRAKSLKIESLFVLIRAGLIAVVFFMLISTIGDFLLIEYFQTSAYLEVRNQKSLNQFENFVKANQVKASDFKRIEDWQKSQKFGDIELLIVKDQEIIFNSFYKGVEEGDGVAHPEEVTQEVLFQDGKAMVSLNGNYDYAYYVNSMVIEVILSVAVFLLIFIRFIDKKINYILKLETEIKILETGDLTYSIAVEGDDEIASLAQGLNQMRVALLENIRMEEEALQANHDLVVSMAHDFRTPLTALLLYLDILRKGQNDSDEKMSIYIDKAIEKGIQIKRMSDQIFERFLVTATNSTYNVQPQKIRIVFEDLLSDLIEYLTENKRIVDAYINWENNYVMIQDDYIRRIFDNISSNLIKYADPDKPIKIAMFQRESWLIISFENSVSDKNKNVESTGIGTKNIKNMMANMNGNYVIHQAYQGFYQELCFPIENPSKSEVFS